MSPTRAPTPSPSLTAVGVQTVGVVGELLRSTSTRTGAPPGAPSIARGEVESSRSELDGLVCAKNWSSRADLELPLTDSATTLHKSLMPRLVYCRLLLLSSTLPSSR